MKVWLSCATMVRQAPLIATLSPTVDSPAMEAASMVKRLPCASAWMCRTIPRVSTNPVNMIEHSDGVFSETFHCGSG